MSTNRRLPLRGAIAFGTLIGGKSYRLYPRLLHQIFAQLGRRRLHIIREHVDHDAYRAPISATSVRAVIHTVTGADVRALPPLCGCQMFCAFAFLLLRTDLREQVRRSFPQRPVQLWKPDTLI